MEIIIYFSRKMAPIVIGFRDGLGFRVRDRAMGLGIG